jgi:hypothetical protein
LVGDSVLLLQLRVAHPIDGAEQVQEKRKMKMDE